MWYHKLSEILKKHQFKMSIHDEALFIIDKIPENPVWCLIYVDDILMTSPSALMLSETVEALKEDLTLTSKETLSDYLSMNLWKTDTREICLSAEKYAQKLQGKFQLSSGGKRVYTPLPPSEPRGTKPVTAMNKFEYLSKTGSLLYASTCCKPDLQHGESTMAQANK